VPSGLSLTQAIQRYAPLGSEATESVASERRAAESLPPKQYDQSPIDENGTTVEGWLRIKTLNK
jgi:hypothetical protein